MAKGYLYDNGDELITREDVNEVPDSSTAHAGDVLELDSNKKPKWSTPESELPDTTSASAGDVLSLNSSKEPVWSAPSGGGGGIECYVDYEATPVTDDQNEYYPAKIRSNNDPLSAEFISNNYDENIYIVVNRETTIGTALVSYYYVIPIYGVIKVVEGGVTGYEELKAGVVSDFFAPDMSYQTYGNYNIYVGPQK